MTPVGWPHPCSRVGVACTCFSLDFFPHFYRVYRYFPYPGLPRTERHPMPSPTGMQIYDTQGHRLYLTGSERAAFRTAAEAAPREVRTYCWTLLYTGCRPSEALALTADRVDFQAAVLTFESKKKRRPGLYRAVPVPASAPRCPGYGAWPPRPRHPDVSLDVEPENRLHPRHRDHGTGRHRGPPSEPQRACGMALAWPVSKKGSRSISCSAGWAMPSSRRRRSMPTRWARKSAISPPASGPDTRQPYGRDSFVVACSDR